MSAASAFVPDEGQRRHRASRAGPKAERKKERREKKRRPDIHDKDGAGAGAAAAKKKPLNMKAFGVASAVSAARTIRRTLDLENKKLHAPVVDRTPEEPAPYVVAVVGPPGVGKSTLVRSLVKYFTKRSISQVQGPISVVTGKNRRITLFECPNDLNAMMDVGKVADLVLLMIDASFGFEMETFEFLNILNCHGFPKIIGVLTHLDQFKDNKRLQKTKKRLKKRFWTEVYDGAKLFYLSGLVHGRYPKMEIHNLARFISVTKFRPLVWRSSHPYVLADRMEDLTDPAVLQRTPKADRRIALYGYLRGSLLKPQMKVHVPGAGDFFMRSVTELPDPCATPVQQGKRTLGDKQKVLYAPMADVGNLLYDKDAVYVNIHNPILSVAPASTAAGNSDDDDDDHDDDATGGAATASTAAAPATPGEAMLRELQRVEASGALNREIDDSQLRLFSDAKPLRSSDVDRMLQAGRQRRRAVFDDDDDDDDEAGGGDDDEDDEDDEDGDDEDGDDDDDDDDDDGDADGKGAKRVRRRGPALRSARDGPGAAAGEVLHFDDSDDSDADGANSDDDGPRFAPRGRGKRASPDDDSDDDDEDDEDDEEDEDDQDVADHSDRLLSTAEVDAGLHAKWKDRLNTSLLLNKPVSLMELVYGDADATAAADDGGDDDDGGDFFKPVAGSKKRSASGGGSAGGNGDDDADADDADGDTSKYTQRLHEWQPEEAALLKSRFSFGGDGATASTTSGGDDALDGDFEDLETGAKHKAGGGGGGGDDGGDGDGDGDGDDAEEVLRQERQRQKAQLKKAFDSAYDDTKEPTYFSELKEELGRQAELNREKLRGEDPATRPGLYAGLYVRIELDSVPCEFVQYFDARYPIIVGGLHANEEALGLVQVRIKRHRWHRKVLKTSDPLIFSIGWRRFQTLPLYSIDDRSARNRMLKYTPEHMHCTATFYGPMTPPNTGFIAFQTLSNAVPHFRVSATGTVLELDQSFAIVKKLKLTGVPFKIFKATAFIKDMFNDVLEVAKFEGASVRTVSGIRGQIKKALRAPPGAFRATFEDKILMSDIVFLRTWYPVEPARYYNPVTSLLAPVKSDWQGMKTVYQLRRDKQLAIPIQSDSVYRSVERQARRFNPLQIPKSLQRDLPFASKPKLDVAVSGSRRRKSYTSARAVVMEPEERKVYTLLQQINTIKNERLVKRKQKQQLRSQLHKKEMAKKEAAQKDKLKPALKAFYRARGMDEKHKRMRASEAE